MALSSARAPQPAATDANSTADMGHYREATPSNSNFLAAPCSALEWAHKAAGGL
jgi:hypothetical protein